MPATSSARNMSTPVHQQIANLQQKIHLLEHDGSAYYESSQATIKKNQDTILRLRQESKRLCKKLAEAHAGDNEVIRQAFQSHGSEMAVFRNMSVKTAIEVLDQKVCEKVKKLNALKYTTHTFWQQLDELQEQYKLQAAERHGPTSEEDGKNLRVLENRLDKAQLKCQEAEYVMRSYLKLKDHLQEESLTFPSQLNLLEAEILHKRQELRELEAMNKDAGLCKDTAKAELQSQEEQMYVERRERELYLSCHKTQGEDRRAKVERGDRRAQWVAMNADEMSQRSANGRGDGEDERIISCFEEAFQCIKETTGVTNPQEVMDKFISQQQMQRHLEELKLMNEAILKQQRDERDKLQIHLNQIKYTGETKLASGRNILEENELIMQKELQRKDLAKEKLDYLTHRLNAITAGVEHFTNKLQHIPQLNKSKQKESLEQVLQLLCHAEQNMQWLKKELRGRDLLALKKEMEEEEFHASIEGKLPQYNTRIILPDIQKFELYEDEENGEDEGDIITRDSLKRQSQLIIDSSNKNKARIRKRQGHP